jgi:hypothetical protein
VAAVTEPVGAPGSAPRRFLAWLARHPILCLAILTPGIPEYLSTSSPVLELALNPFAFFLFLAVNVGQYTAGALLVREAALRWRKGWASIFLLGGAYAITEEGLGDNTLFNNTHHVDAVLGQWGHFAGVNWVWSVGVISFHVIYSIGLPILLLGLALPQTRGRPLVGRRGVTICFATLVGSTALESVIVWGQYRFWLGVPLLLGSLVAVVLLVALAYRIPATLWDPSRERTTARPWQVGLIGFGFFPIAFLLEYGLADGPLPPYGVILVELVLFSLLLEALRRGIGRSANEYLLVNLAFGFIAWQAVFGFLLTLGLPYTLPLDAVAVLFFVRLRRQYRPAAPIPRAVLGAEGGVTFRPP